MASFGLQFLMLHNMPYDISSIFVYPSKDSDNILKFSTFNLSRNLTLLPTWTYSHPDTSQDVPKQNIIYLAFYNTIHFLWLLENFRVTQKGVHQFVQWKKTEIKTISCSWPQFQIISESHKLD